MAYSVNQVRWEQAAPILRNIREKVCICEWRTPKHIEFDHLDTQAYHILICNEPKHLPIATGRMLPSGEISRIAVLTGFRQQNIDKAILQGLCNIAKNLDLIDVFMLKRLDSADQFIDENFCRVGHVFMEAGIAKQRMVCSIEQVLTELNNPKYQMKH